MVCPTMLVCQRREVGLDGVGSHQSCNGLPKLIGVRLRALQFGPSADPASPHVANVRFEFSLSASPVDAARQL